MTDAPPSRYKVVERGRRLVVIDTRTGQPAVREPVVRAPSPSGTPAVRPVETMTPSSVDDRSGSAILTTSRLYDLKGPRRIVMSDNFSNRLGRALGGWIIALFIFVAVTALFFPWLLLLPLVMLFQPKARAVFRQWITARLDETDRTAS
ncbi:hypothetical protein OK349_11130 [Sphingomonas sp. BT-65]|uniref:hypothetical protein n=1 Tax=Sphingomonas sp. BT-65 TaxID=2989821 RepID=UPI002236A7E0|nr:hypothetical protein [Sphingomonas sp. BT-65]MCW4462259.1 hypothetical protein [Sphingomonas sp. BT-65]